MKRALRIKTQSYARDLNELIRIELRRGGLHFTL
jgi:hypothetical protein